jgi:prolyl-tRNA editing enzyme YbaK/EbsC (Cys-tRNA(Pro) deacylase)
MPQSTRTAEDAARAVGCQVGQIVKSLVFQGKQSHQALLVATSGANRVNEKKIAGLISEPLSKADADFVRDKTGFAIGGVPPVAHAQPIRIFIDEDLLQYDEIWAAAGTPRALFKLTPQDLQKIRRAGGLGQIGYKLKGSRYRVTRIWNSECGIWK